jgi:hypothetical protein
LFAKSELLSIFKALLGIEGIKPFECVGTNEEVAMGMKKALDVRNGPLPLVLEMFVREV